MSVQVWLSERNLHIKNILYGKSQNPKLITIKMICDGLGITFGEFFGTPEFDALEQEVT